MLNWQIIEVKIKKKDNTTRNTYPNRISYSKDQVQLIMEKKKISRQP